MFKRLFITSSFVIIALAAIGWKYQQYIINPWTRDGLVRAQIVQITPRVTGPIIALNIKNNSEVKTGQVLFVVDPRPYEIAVEKAKGNRDQAKAQLQRAQDEATRERELIHRQPGAISQMTLVQQKISVRLAQAGVEAAQAVYDQSKLDLSFTKVTAPVDGYITNLNVNIGTQVVANQPVVALIDKHSFWIEGFFKETDIKDVASGDKATVTLMAYGDQPLQGSVESIGYGISHKNGSTGLSLLPNVNPTFQWIRLAQRIPVQIRLDHIPDGIQFRIGSSASIVIHKNQQNQSLIEMVKGML
ncbi:MULTISPECIES: HlyD family secretion protein [Photobacterium]|jgi:RND family efflux transporter MFP subunit|uniref:Efflux transporter periplasmic adaptor subunit n=2 Tax=Photobacterium carnosum TaxID=2023717 RepID=A0A2N4UNW8_9GAMM|nr:MULTISPECIES: HlyD family secretion protein [Photobacterium]MCD9468248.1 efflux transporter periplasmic adaptor subunit [Photobacterium iliopiscarium]MCD9488188.1 efflux RND transporter periplasmic adaptor subunit [Photobacterium iliopiscarium]MCD9524020.1 efflux RND transporter periplasmic adaptor subunit [Photobacterium carnosum]MCD9531370.1 efflux RND transporter periplasmic adaptor subunit [Photobacterium carnosum]MCD9549590.1 efflux RND transporter periplasmic adaptor subunit [Photobac